MNVFQRVKGWIRKRVAEVVTDDERRFRLQMIWVFRIMAIVAAVMAAVNVITGEHISILSTLLFSAVCYGVTVWFERFPDHKRTVIAAMMAAVLVLFGYFIISGEPEGFSPIWICIVPPVALLLLGRWPGGLFCLLLFLLQIILMWTPWGRGLLQHEYPEIFLLRLPLVYTAAFWISWFLEYVREITQKQLVQAQKSYQHLYRHDALTGIMNRYGFNEHIAQVMKQENGDLALMFIDLDDFKKTNDQYGHPAGDAVLRAVSETVGRVIGEAGEVSRWGGEEFAVLMHRAEGAPEMAEALRLAIAAMHVESGKEVIQTTVSIGLTVCGPGKVDQERLVTLTDQCLYRAKKNGKNQAVWCEYTED